MNDLIQRITNAIFRQEGMGPDHANPGYLRDCPWFARIAGGGRMYPEEVDGAAEPVKYANGFWVPRSRAEGIAGAAHLVSLHIAQGNTLRDFIAGHPGVYAGFAPGADKNDPATYIANVKLWASIPNTDLPLWNYIMELPT
jgi:hypothetical protein